MKSSATWTKKNLFDPATVKAATHIPFVTRLKLLFRKTFVSFDESNDGAVLTHYKVLGGRTYVMSVDFYPPKAAQKDKP